MTVSAVLLLGSNHTELGEVATEELPPQVAVGISRGRFPKGYAHVDPNEDAVFAATDGTTTILVVADGHHGFDAAHEAVLTVADITPRLIDEDLESTVRDLAAAAIAAVAITVPSLDSPRNTSATALTIAAIRDHTIAASTIGDTSCLISTRRRTVRLGTSTPFLDPHTDPGMLHVDVGEVPAKGVIVVASDGFTDFAKPVGRSVRSTPNHSPMKAVDSLIADAFAGGAGDNIAVAVFTTA